MQVVLMKIIFFVSGLFVYRGLMRRMNIFALEERDTLYAMFDSRGIRFVRGLL